MSLSVLQIGLVEPKPVKGKRRVVVEVEREGEKTLA